MNNDDRQKMADISAQYKLITDQLATLIDQQKNLGNQLSQLPGLQDRFDEMESDTKDLVKAWEAAGVLLGVVKWAASIGTALLTFAASVWVLIEKILPHIRNHP